MITAPAPARAVRRAGAPVLASSALFHWQARRLSPYALTGQVGTLVRASTGTAVDGLGTTWTAQHSMLRHEARDWSGTGVRDTLGLRMTTDDLAWPVNFLPGQGTLYIEFAEVATISASATLVYLGNDAISGARLTVDSAGTYYRAILTDGSTSETVTLAAAAPTADQCARLAVQVQFSDDLTQWRHRLLLDVLRDTVDEATAWSTYQTAPAAWGATTRVRLNRAGSAGTQGSTWVRDVAWFPELRTLDECAWL